MSMYRELSYENQISTIKGIQFCVLSAEQILSRSVAEINKSETYNGNDPVQHGIFDPRMGVIEHNKVCVTCEKKNTFCPGHFGHIVLAKPVFYIQFFPIVRGMLKCICYRCSKLLVDADSDEIKALMAKKGSRQKRYEIISKMSSKIKRCGQCTVDGCGYKQPAITKEGMLKLAMEWKDMGADIEVRKQILNAEDVLRIFRRISERDAEILGFNKKFNRPEDLICTILPVPPPAVRPSVRNDTGQRSEDDLTHKLSTIVKVNNQLKARVEKGVKDYIDMFSMLLQYEVATMIDNTIPGINPAVQRTGRPIRSLIERLKGKEGRIRGNLMGKRVDFSARSVITPDPNISIDELGVPIKIAMNLTFPEVVNERNIEELATFVLNGPDVFPGAKHVRKKSDGRTIRLRNMDRTTVELEMGDIVDRHMRNGDYVLFNRQPSLHRSSMMAHRVRVMPYNTFRLNVMVTPSFNADFDGDEMNMHVPQSYQSHEELLQLAAVPTQIISLREYQPIVSVVQDNVAGLYLLTKRHVQITDKQMSNIMSANPRCDGALEVAKYINGSDHKWSGHQLLSTIMPRKITLNMGNSHYDADKGNMEHFVKIHCGQVLQGTFDKGIYQQRTVGIVHSIYNEYGPDETKVFFDNTQQLICNWLVLNGFSVGISDMVVDRDSMDKFTSIISEMKTKVYKLIGDVHGGKYENNSTKTNYEDFEKKVNDELNDVIKQVGEAGVKRIHEDTNRLINMIKSKSKGSTINVSQMIGCLGQQNVDGRRIPNGFDDRTLPHYTKYDDGPEAHGFVESSFIKGLTPQEFFFAAMGGREGLIDTAVMSVTWETPLIIIEGGKPKHVLIGEWIDAHLDKAKDNIRLFEEKNMELLDLPKESVYIPTCDADGKMTWGELTAVTRHDPGERLYKVTTYCGRQVTVAESKSLLVWDPEVKKLLEVDSTSIKVGDLMPVTMNMYLPPVLITHVDMAEYLPKTEYIYGSEFHKAVKMMKEAQGDKFFIPRGWWEKNNGITFTTPYTKKASLQRVIGRSNIENIKEGCVYPYHATRCHGHMPAQFELNKENGTFIGIFLADGHTWEHSGHVSITKNEKSVQEWVTAWFTKHGFASKLYVKVIEKTEGNKWAGTTSTIQGYSQLLGRFLNAFVDQGSRNKYVPDVAFTAPEEFAVGILNGYFSGDGTLTSTSIGADSSSRRLLEGISMLCNTIGVFGRLTSTQQLSNNLGTKDIAPMHRLTFRGNFGSLLASKLELIHAKKQAQLDALVCTDKYNIQVFRDMVLDPIASIEILGVEGHPKLYDVTVPSTLNFGLRDGLMVRDTSETGYLQRKLVKAMEDCKVGYDYSVRNAAGAIVQFLYGDDGMDACKIESQKIPYVEMTQDQLAGEYLLEGFEEHFEQIKRDREFVIMRLFKGQAENTLAYPISLFRTINIAKGLTMEGTKLDPKHVLDALHKLEQELHVNNHHRGTQLLHILLRAYLSPKVSIVKHGLNLETFDYIIEQVRAKFYQSLASPLEMVGVIAAQSLGEPSTQLCQLSASRVQVLYDGKMYDGPVGDFIDDIMDANKSKLVDLGGDSTVFDPIKDMFIVGVSDTEKTSWRRISQISRHPAKGGMVRIHTRSGKTTCATLSHSFLRRTERGIEPVLGSDLKAGDRVPVARQIPQVLEKFLINTVNIGDKVIELTKDFGWLCGAYVADGHCAPGKVSISKVHPMYQDKLRQVYKDVFGLDMSQYFHKGSGILNGYDMSNYNGAENIVYNANLQRFMQDSFKTGSHRKRIPSWVYTANIEFIKGLLCGYFDGDGCSEGEDGKAMLRTASVSEKLTEDFIMLFARVGIFASKCRERHLKEKDRNDLHTAVIPRKFARKLRETIGPLVVKEKDDGLIQMIEYVERDDAHDHGEYIDKIPELGHLLAAVGKGLELPGQSRLYRRFINKESIGRETLRSYMPIFEEALEEQTNAVNEQFRIFKGRLIRLRNVLRVVNATPDAIDRNGVMDLDEESGATMLELRTPLMGCKALGAANLYTNVRNKRITAKCFDFNMRALWDANNVKHATDMKRLNDIRNDKLPALRQALDADVVWDEIMKVEKLPDPEEMVYDFTVPGNDSFMVDCGVLVHNTLNSVHHDTELLLRIDGQLTRTTIGEFTEGHIAKSSVQRLEHHPNDTTLAWLKDGGEEGPISSKVEVLAPTEDGKIIWDEVCAVTKHPVKNEDGSDTLLHVQTRSGREVIATKGDSFVMRVDNKIQKVKGSDLKLGDALPVSNVLPIDKELIDFGNYALTYELGHMMGKYMSGDENAISNQLKSVFGENKRLPAELLSANKDFLRGVVDGYEFQSSNDDLYLIHLRLNLKIDNYPVDIKFSNGTSTQLDKLVIADMITYTASASDKAILSKVLEEEVFYDPIVSIKEVANTKSHVYDLTTRETHCFCLYSSLSVFDTFHLAGVSSASKSVRGVPRLKELLSVSKNMKTPSMRITFRDNLKSDKDKCEALMHDVRVVRFKDIVTKSQIFFDPNDTYQEDKSFVSLYQDDDPVTIKTAPWLIRLEFDKESMMRYHLDMIQIHNKLLDFYKEDTIVCKFSDDNAEQLVFRIKLAIIPTSDNDMYTEIKALETIILEKIMIKGTEGIENVSMEKSDVMQYNAASQAFDKAVEYIVYTDGTNFKDLLANEHIDAARLHTNNVNEILDTLGIEAARQALFNEIQLVMEGVTVNYRHIALLVDMQTNKGTILSVDRHGINRGDIGPLAKCSFEESTEKLIKAGAFAEYDKINGVSANIMLGQMVPAGTGDVALIMDEDMLPEEEDIPEDEELNVADELCQEDVFGFDFVVPDV